MALRFSSCDHFHYSASEWLRLAWNALVERHGLNITIGSCEAQITTFNIIYSESWPTENSAYQHAFHKVTTETQDRKFLYFPKIPGIVTNKLVYCK